MRRLLRAEVSALAMTTMVMICFFSAPKVFADAVYLTSGDIIKGVVVEDHCDRIVMSTYKGEVEILKFTIDQIFFDNEEQNYTYLGDKALSSGDLDSAFGFYQKAVQINPDFEKVNGAFLRLTDAVNRKKLNIKPQEFFAELIKQSGISIEKYKNKIRVTAVKKDSPAENASIGKGDFITDVWDKSIMYMDAESAAEVMLGDPLSAVRFSIEKNITLPVKPLPWFKKIFSFLMFNDFGFKLALRPQGLIVSYVSPQGLGKECGLKPLDEVTHINNESTRYMPVSMVRRKIFQSNLKEVVLTVKRQVIVMRGGQK